MEKNGCCLINLRKNVIDGFFILVYLSFICILLFRILILGIHLVTNGIPTILCSISVIWNFCWKGSIKFNSVPLFEWEEGTTGFFQNLLNLIHKL